MDNADLELELARLRTQQARYEERIRKVNRVRRAQRTWWVLVLLTGIAMGFALAEWLIDPVTVITSCGGEQV